MDKSPSAIFAYVLKIIGWVISAIFLGFVVAALLYYALIEWLEISTEKSFRLVFLPSLIIFASFFVWITIRNIRNEIKGSFGRTKQRKE